MSSLRKSSIGVFDSGFGGINVLRGIVKSLPKYHYLYLGDSARAPYGNRSKATIYAFSKQAVDFLFANGCELIVFACNTASSDALRKIQREYVPKRHPGKKVLGVLIPAAEEAASRTKNKRVGVIATKATVRSKAFVRELTKLDNDIKVFQNPCPLLVPMIEAGKERSPAMATMLKKYLQPLKNKKIDTLILGCTHYGILEEAIKKIMGQDIAVIASTKVVPKKLRDYLARHPEIKKRLNKDRKIQFISTGPAKKFTDLGSRFFDKKITAKKVRLS